MDALLIGPLATVAMSERKAGLAGCGESGTAVRLRWEVRNGRWAKVEAEGDERVGRCLEKVLADAPAAFVGTCVATMRIP